MEHLRLVKHAAGAPGLRILGLGPSFTPLNGLSQLKELLDRHAFWAKGRNYRNLRKALAGSSVVVTLWRGNRIIGFGRATSDGIYRSVLWDIVVADELQGKGLGKKVVEALLSTNPLKKAEKIYLMTTNSSEFYKQLGFERCCNQDLLVKVNIL